MNRLKHFLIATRVISPGGLHGRILKGIIAFLLGLKLAIWIVFPDPGVDGPMYLSHTFSVLDGALFHNNFLSGYIEVFNFPYLFGFFNAPFYYFFQGTFLQTYSIFIANIFWIVLFIAGVWFRYKDNGIPDVAKCLLLLTAYLSAVYTFTLRSETFIIPFLLLLTILLDKSFMKDSIFFKFVLIPFVIAVIGLMHPVAGLIACLLTGMYSLEMRMSPAGLLLQGGLTLLFVLLLYLPVVMLDFDHWKHDFLQVGFMNRQHSFTDFSPLLKFAAYNPGIILVILIIVYCSQERVKELLILILFLGVILFFHQSYYFQYLFVYGFWRLKRVSLENLQRILSAISMVCFFSYGFFIIYLLPAIQISENPAYVRTFKSIQLFLSKAVPGDPGHLIWIPGNFAMPVINHDNLRLHWYFILDYKATMKPIDGSSVFYVTNPRQIDYIRLYPFAKAPEISVTNIITPVKGLITVGDNLSRSDSLGLWRINIIN